MCPGKWEPSGYPEEGFSLEEIQKFFLDKSRHNKKFKQPDSYTTTPWLFNAKEYNGLFMQAHNTVIVMKNYVLHNDGGPAKVMFTKEGKPYYSLFARNGEVIPWDDFEAKLRTAQVKRMETKMRDDAESKEK